MNMSVTSLWSKTHMASFASTYINLGKNSHKWKTIYSQALQLSHDYSNISQATFSRRITRFINATRNPPVLATSAPVVTNIPTTDKSTPVETTPQITSAPMATNIPRSVESTPQIKKATLSWTQPKSNRGPASKQCITCKANPSKPKCDGTSRGCQKDCSNCLKAKHPCNGHHPSCLKLISRSKFGPHESLKQSKLNFPNPNAMVLEKTA